MQLTHLSLSNFRSYIRLDTDIPGRILLLSGGNAQGKTTLLEALFYCASFMSPLARNDRQLITFSASSEPLSVGRIVASFEREGKSHKIEVRFIQETDGENSRIRKEILLDGMKSTAQKAIGSFPAVLFLPQMTRILEGPPDERRRYLNIMLSQSVQGYARALSEYKQILQRRNALLKILSERKTDPAQLDYWDLMMAQRAAILMKARSGAIRYLQEKGRDIHNELTDGKEVFRLQYTPGYDPFEFAAVDHPTIEEMDENALVEGYRYFLQSHREKDIQKGSTGKGPHRDDFTVHGNEVDLCAYGSRGQICTTLLTMKFSEMEWMRERTHTSPLLLLDETLAELDEKRGKDLLTRLERYEQAILTTTDCTHFPQSFISRNSLWVIENGVIKDKSEYEN